MASLGMMLAGSAIGQGAGQFVHQQAQGAFDRQRLDQTTAENNFKQGQMDRTVQQQGIEDQITDGATDEDRLNQLADIAGKAGRGDLQRKYQGAAKEARQNLHLHLVSKAANAISFGQFDEATRILNQTDDFKGVHSIGLADDAPQNTNNPTYSVYTAGPSDANGNPTRGPHVHVTGEILQGIAHNPKLLPQLMGQAQAQSQKNDIAERNLDIKSDHYDSEDNHWKSQDAVAMQRARSMGAGGAGKLTDKRWLYQWAQSQIGKPGGFKDNAEAMKWAMDPNRQNKDYWQSIKLAGSLQNSGAIVEKDGRSNAVEIITALKEYAESLRKPPTAGPTPPPTAGRAAPDFKALGFEQDSKTGNWRNPKTGVWFKSDDKGNTFAWSNTQKTWVPAQ